MRSYYWYLLQQALMFTLATAATVTNAVIESPLTRGLFYYSYRY
ncbi:exported hypothetical protein [Vibrio coralliirubri]|nr:exported hypothetical protein [Vibrio coralliirubri]CDT87659.1 exported hypothetical protein [Vibrio coralliirubri]CDU09956.1 exported hypothetical protein [Vibrio coralliirubri]